MFNKKSSRLYYYVFIFAMLITTGTGCLVTKSKNDSTPPVITKWTIYNFDTNETQTFSANGGSMTVARGQRYRLTCLANDPEGAQKLTVGASGIFGCSFLDNGSIFTKMETVIIYPAENEFSKPDDKDQVKSSLVYVKDFVINKEYPCDASKIPFKATVENFSSQKAQGDVTLQIK